jgi:hypothetical protein
MTRPDTGPDGHQLPPQERTWLELDDATERTARDYFYHQYDFHPSIHRERWPSLREPTRSVTFDTSHIATGDEDSYTRQLRPNRDLLAALRLRTPPGGTLLALDRQHTGYLFRPHLLTEPNDEDSRRIEPYPNGDYHVFCDPELRLWLFGHPWEQTLCAYGHPPTACLPEDRATAAPLRHSRPEPHNARALRGSTAATPWSTATAS